MSDQEQGNSVKEEKPAPQNPPPVIELKVNRVMDSDNTRDRSRVLNEKDE
jgi:hypothetical protein